MNLSQVRPFRANAPPNGLLSACLAVLTVLTVSCDRQPRGTTIDVSKYQPQIILSDTPVLDCDHYPTLCKKPERRTVVRQYLSDWKKDPAVSHNSTSKRDVLTVYAACYKDLGNATRPANWEKAFRALWDLAGIAHITAISPEAIINAAGADPNADIAYPVSSHRDPIREGIDTPTTIPIAALPEPVRRMLAAVKTGQDEEGGTFADFVAQTAYGIHFTLNLSEWSPACPLDVCGSSEPLTRTIILIPASYVDKVRKPDWSLAAVAVHESAHIDWFYKPEVSADPRLLLPVPNERHAWLMTLRFLRPLLQLQPGPIREDVRKNAQGIQQMLGNARRKIAHANRILGLPKDDETPCLTLPEGVTREALYRLP